MCFFFGFSEKREADLGCAWDLTVFGKSLGRKSGKMADPNLSPDFCL